jgi:Tol biopolymer transport system component
MALQAGSRIGSYEIVALIGAGGMGEVYRARDSRLGRDVAVKIVSPAIASNADGLMRFEREARMLASLNHPNIAAIYGVEDTDGQPALVLELIDGETLADRVSRGPLRVDEALALARQIADALDAAHEAGIVHRDLKPANIKITDSGTIKVLDFGLAKAIAAAIGPDPAVDPSRSPTVTVHGTRHGVILGTVAYMSPEQARGKAIDKRTDIWAFGCVLFEMLTGQRPFAGETTSDVIAAIIERQPEWSKLPPSTPTHVRRVIERCLEKDPKRRARDIADVAVQLDRDVGVAVAPQPTARGMKWWVIGAAVIVLAAVLGAVVARWATPAPGDPPAVEFALGPPPNHTLSEPPSLSPDGRLIAFLVRDANLVLSVWIRPLDGGAPRRLEGTQGATGRPVWAPDSRALAVLIGDSWKRISVEGGPLVTIVSGAVADMGASWGPDDTILVALANRTVLSRVPAAGGRLDAVTTLDVQKENSHRWPQVLPDGRHFLFTVRSDRPENLGIKIGTFGSPAVRPLVSAPSPARFAEPGWLLFMTPDEVLMAQRLEPGTWSLTGSPQPVAASVRYNGPSYYGAFDVSRDGRVLTYTPAAPTHGALTWFDRSGKSLGTVGPERRYRSLRLAPDARRAAIELADDRYGTRDIWLLDIGTNALTRLTANSATDWRPVFSPDGNTLAFASDRAGASTVFRTAADGSGGETVLYRHPDGGAFPSDWSRDGKHVLVQLEDSQGRRTGFVSVPVDGRPASTIIDDDQSEMTGGRYSPEGDRVAFSSTATGTAEIYVMSLADRRRVRVSTDGGIGPVWGRDGRELYFYDQRGAIMLATIDSGPAMVGARPALAMRPCVAVNRVFASSAAEPGFDVSADGARVLARCESQDVIPSAHTVVVNWQSRLR